MLCVTLFTINLSAQVTIGSGLAPTKGALLDLKEYELPNRLDNATRGLMLPRVSLEKKNDLAPCVAGLSPTDEKRKEHVGLVVYNLATIYSEGFCPGVYAWSGDNSWIRVNGDCNGFAISGVANSYVMDGQEYSFKLNTFDDWTAEINSDPSNIIHSLTSTSGGTVVDFDFKFKMNIKNDANASAIIKMKSNKGQEQLITINGEIPVIRITTPSIAAAVDQADYPYTYSSNSSLPLAAASNNSWITLVGGQARVADNNLGSINTGSITVSNGAAVPQNITVTQAALELNLSTSTMTAHVDGQNTGYTYTSNSARTPTVSSSNTGWLTGNSHTVYAGMTNDGASRSANIYVAIGNVTKAITVTQAALTLNLSTSSMAPHVDGQNTGYTYSSNSARTPTVSSSNTEWLTGNSHTVGGFYKLVL